MTSEGQSPAGGRDGTVARPAARPAFDTSIAHQARMPKLAESRDRVNRISHQRYTHHSHAEVLRFFDGLELVEPGLVELRKWRPAVQSSRLTPDGAGWGASPDP